MFEGCLVIGRASHDGVRDDGVQVSESARPEPVDDARVHFVAVVAAVEGRRGDAVVAQVVLT